MLEMKWAVLGVDKKKKERGYDMFVLLGGLLLVFFWYPLSNGNDLVEI